MNPDSSMKAGKLIRMAQSGLNAGQKDLKSEHHPALITRSSFIQAATIPFWGSVNAKVDGANQINPANRIVNRDFG